jgi:hypothetical protein
MGLNGDKARSLFFYNSFTISSGYDKWFILKHLIILNLHADSKRSLNT